MVYVDVHSIESLLLTLRSCTNKNNVIHVYSEGHLATTERDPINSEFYIHTRRNFQDF